MLQIEQELLMFFIFVKKTMAYHKLKINSIKSLTSEASAIGFEVPSSIKDLFEYNSGQYINLKATIKGGEVRRSYSLCSAPNDGILEVGIKRIKGGLFSTYATQELKVGDLIEVGEPEGRFIYKEDAKNVTAFAAGSGITPVYSILKTALASGKDTHFTLVYGNKSPGETLFYNELKKLETDFPRQLKVLWLFSQSNEEGSRFGRIDSSIVKYVLKNTGQLSTAFYLCGPEAMILEVKETLLNNSIEENQINFELFTASKTTDTAAVETSEDEVVLEIIADYETNTIKTKASTTILDAALNQKIDVPYSCQGGVCCSCIAKITSGSASMANNQILTDEEIAEGLVLTCQAVPTSAKVVVNYDDV
tara:strand:+ start:727 stop:1818 length:1092 start_codon:yes stop_codon:yes gene_type:complete